MQPPEQALLDRFLAEHPDVPGVLMYASGPGFAWATSSGVADAASREPLHPDATFRIASITKTYVAAATLRLMELGKLELEDTVDDHLGDDDIRAELGDHRCRTIEIRHLLSHTSGLADFVEDTDYATRTLSDLQRRWSRIEQIRLGLSLTDVAPPGTSFHYSDTGYAVLGSIIEHLTGDDLATSLRSLLRFDDHGFEVTYLESLEPVPTAAASRAHQYTDGVDTFDADPSFDLWGGGGLVSSTAEISAFFRALFEGEIFDRAETLDRMLTRTAHAEGADIGFGIAAREFGGHRLWGHGGYWGNYAGFLPDAGIAFAVAILERSALEAMATQLLPETLELALQAASS